MGYSGGGENEESHGVFTMERFHLPGSINVLSKFHCNLPMEKKKKTANHPLGTMNTNTIFHG